MFYSIVKKFNLKLLQNGDYIIQNNIFLDMIKLMQLFFNKEHPAFRVQYNISSVCDNKTP